MQFRIGLSENGKLLFPGSGRRRPLKQNLVVHDFLVRYGGLLTHREPLPEGDEESDPRGCDRGLHRTFSVLPRCDTRLRSFRMLHDPCLQKDTASYFASRMPSSLSRGRPPSFPSPARKSCRRTEYPAVSGQDEERLNRLRTRERSLSRDPTPKCWRNHSAREPLSGPRSYSARARRIIASSASPERLSRISLYRASPFRIFSSDSAARSQTHRSPSSRGLSPTALRSDSSVNAPRLSVIHLERAFRKSRTFPGHG